MCYKMAAMRPFLTLALFLILVGFAGSCHDQAKISTSTIVVQSSGSCLDVNDGSSQAGLGIDQQKCSGTNNQSFKFTALADGYYAIRPENNNLCLDAGPGSIITGVQVVQNACSGSNTQKWKVNPNSDGSFTIATPNGAGCMDVYAGSTANGAIVTTYACHGSNNESFIMSGFKPSSTQTPTAPPTPASASAPASTGSTSVSAMVVEASGLCVDVHDSSSQLGLGIDQWTCSGANNQSFTFTAIPGGYYTIQAQNDGLCLDAGAGSVTTGIQVVQNTCSGSNTQKWKSCQWCASHNVCVPRLQQ